MAKRIIGYNARENKFENFFEAGIIDPTKVTRLALENAASIAGLLLTTEAVVSEIRRRKSSTCNASRRRWNGRNDVITFGLSRESGKSDSNKKGTASKGQSFFLQGKEEVVCKVWFFSLRSGQRIGFIWRFKRTII